MARAPDAFDQFVAAHVDDLLRTAVELDLSGVTHEPSRQGCR
jgi:hypothetical protein